MELVFVFLHGKSFSNLIIDFIIPHRPVVYMFQVAQKSEL